MDEREILNAIADMIATERSVRSQLRDGEVDESSARAELDSLGSFLDQCWDLLRQRRARRRRRRR
jgi:hypothetical protein